MRFLPPSTWGDTTFLSLKLNAPFTSCWPEMQPRAHLPLLQLLYLWWDSNTIPQSVGVCVYFPSCTYVQLYKCTFPLLAARSHALWGSGPIFILFWILQVKLGPCPLRKRFPVISPCWKLDIGETRGVSTKQRNQEDKRKRGSRRSGDAEGCSVWGPLYPVEKDTNWPTARGKWCLSLGRVT